MPEELEKNLWKEARVKFPNDKMRQKTYVYGALRNKTNWKPKKEQG
jgi:hypothetical protein